MTDRGDFLMDELAHAVALHLGGDRRAAMDRLFGAAEDPADLCGFATGMAAGIAASVEGDGAVRAVSFPLPGAEPSEEDDDVSGLLAALIAACGNGDMDGAVHAWLAATVRVQIFTLIGLLEVFAETAKEPT